MSRLSAPALARSILPEVQGCAEDLHRPKLHKGIDWDNGALQEGWALKEGCHTLPCALEGPWGRVQGEGCAPQADTPHQEPHLELGC